MSELLGRWTTALDWLPTTLPLPLWSAGILVVLLIVFAALAFNSAGRDGLIGSVARMLLIALGATLTLFFLDGSRSHDFAAERRALELHANALTARAAMPGSPLACLDAMMGDVVEAACARSLFATPESAAAAVSHAAAQLALFGAVSNVVARGNSGMEPLLASLRRAVEGDRYGLIAHVLATRDGCVAERCPALSAMHDAQRVNANLSQHTYDKYITRHSASWPASAAFAGVAPVSNPDAVGTTQPAPGAASGQVVARPPGPGVFFPSSDTIPAVSIMGAEPPAAGAEPTGVAAPTARTPPRRPAQAAPQPKQAPIDLNATARGGAPAAQ